MNVIFISIENETVNTPTRMNRETVNHSNKSFLVIILILFLFYFNLLILKQVKILLNFFKLNKCLKFFFAVNKHLSIQLKSYRVKHLKRIEEKLLFQNVKEIK